MLVVGIILALVAVGAIMYDSYVVRGQLHACKLKLKTCYTRVAELEQHVARLNAIVNPYDGANKIVDETEADEECEEEPAKAAHRDWAPVEHIDMRPGSSAAAAVPTVTRVGNLVLDGDEVIEEEWSSSKSGSDFRRMMKSHWEKIDEARGGTPKWLVEPESDMTVEQRAEWAERVMISAK